MTTVQFEDNRRYETIGTRLALFLAKYPLGDYSLVARPAPIEEYPYYLRKQVENPDVGKPPLLMTTAELRHKDGTLICKASAVTEIVEHKDYERGETAAVQRVIAFCGFRSGMLDNDELKTLDKRGIPYTLLEGESAEPKASAVAVLQDEGVPTGVKFADPPNRVARTRQPEQSQLIGSEAAGATNAAPLAPEGRPSHNGRQESETPQVVSPPPVSTSKSALPLKAVPRGGEGASDIVDPEQQPPHPAVLRQIENLCRQKRQTYAEPKTVQEARSRLLELQRMKPGVPAPAVQAAA